MEDHYMVEEIAWGAERGKSFHLCLTSFCEISLDLVGVFVCWFGVLCSVLVCVGSFCFWDGLVKILHSISTSSFHVSSSWPTMLRARSAMQEKKMDGHQNVLWSISHSHVVREQWKAKSQVSSKVETKQTQNTNTTQTNTTKEDTQKTKWNYAFSAKFSSNLTSLKRRGNSFFELMPCAFDFFLLMPCTLEARTVIKTSCGRSTILRLWENRWNAKS